MPQFLLCGNQGRGEEEEEEERVGVCLGFTPYGRGMQLDPACAKHFRRTDIACINQNILVLSSESSYRFVRRDLSLPKLRFLPL